MLIETMPEVLTWSQGGADTMERVHRAYVMLLGERLGERLREIARLDRMTGSLLADLVRSLPDDSFLRFLVAPETSYHLLWPTRHTPEATARFLDDSLRAELAHAGRFCVCDTPIWTAVGDTRFDPRGGVHRQRQLDAMMPIDVESPHALGLDVDGRIDVMPVPRDPLTQCERELAFARLASARDGIKMTDPAILQSVVTFTKALILLRDTDAPESFSSGSSGQFVGRSYIANAHIDSVDDVQIADAVVHEAIHSLLYMQEQRKAWVYDLNLYGPMVRTRSPWSGNPLPLRPYMQAAFVWYGLLQFWVRAMVAGAFSPDRVRARITIAASGFLGAPLLDQVAEYRAGMASDVLSAIERMQQHVARTFARAA